jgi:hypothetical protein
MLRGIRVKSKAELKSRIEAYLTELNLGNSSLEPSFDDS